MKTQFLLTASALLFSGMLMAQPEIKTTKPVEKVESPVVAVPVPAQEAKKPEEKPDVLLIKESTHDFGKIPQGKPVTTDFVLKNTGTDSLRLESVQPGCGCTTPKWEAGPYAPGQEFKINVGYNAAGEGQFTKPVTITFNGGQQKVINITGTVYSTPSTPAPQNANLGKIKN